jgi:hypothetical protein
MSRVLALDPGPLCGFAWTDSHQDPPTATTQVGVWDFGLRARGGPATAEQRALVIGRALESVAPSEVVYLAMGGYEGLGGSHTDSIVEAVVAWCRARRIPCARIWRPTVKRYATGHGHATFPHLIDAARWELGYEGRDPKEASALWTLAAHLAKEK